MLKDQPGQTYHNASYTYDLLGGLNCCACSILFGVTIPIAWLIFVSVKPPVALKDLTRTIFILCRTVAACDYVPQREREEQRYAELVVKHCQAAPCFHFCVTYSRMFRSFVQIYLKPAKTMSMASACSMGLMSQCWWKIIAFPQLQTIKYARQKFVDRSHPMLRSDMELTEQNWLVVSNIYYVS